MATRNVDVSHLTTVLRTLRDVAIFMTRNENDGDLRAFYASLLTYCVIVHEQRECVGFGGHLHARLLSQFESKITLDMPSITTSPGSHQRTSSSIHTFTHHWRNIQSCTDNSLKLQLIRQCLNFGSTMKERDEFIQLLAECEEDITSREPRGGSEWILGVWDLQKIREPPYTIWKASDGLFKALSGCRSCPCSPIHHVGAQLYLGTYRKPHHVHNSGVDANIDFNMLLSIDLKPRWREICVRTTKETGVHFPDTTGVVRPQNMDRGPNPQRVERLCEPLKNTRERGPFRLEFKIDQGQLFKLKTERKPSRVDAKSDPISLQQFLESWTRSFTEQTKRILAVLLSSAVFHFHGTPWLQPTWCSNDILFFCTSPQEIPIKPYIHSRLSEQYNSFSQEMFANDKVNNPDPDDHLPHHCPSLITLAIMLLEIYFASPLDVIATKFHVELGGNDKTHLPSRYYDAEFTFEACKEQIPDNSGYRYAVEKCLDSSVWEDEYGKKLDSQTLRARIYDEVVRPLEIELLQDYSSSIINIDDLDRFAEGLNFASWGQIIRPWKKHSQTEEPQSVPSNYHQTQLQDIRQLNQVHQSITPRHDPVESAQSTNDTTEYSRFKFFDDEAIAQAHSIEARQNYVEWRRVYKEVYKRFITEPSSELNPRPVRIAVLDTGLDLTHPEIEAIEEKIKGRYNWHVENPQQDVPDHNGHGTFVAGLLLDYAPDAEIYVAKISDHETASPGIIARAINHAVSTWCVDIISMSFGFPTCDIPDYYQLQDAILNASSHKVLLFAAASNNGGRLGHSFPARERDVFAVHATDAYGKQSRFSPYALDDDNIATIGEAIESIWPVQLCDKDSNPSCIKYKSGTSFATPITAGIAAFMLHYAKLYLPEDADALKSHGKMKALLRRAAEKMGANQLRDGYCFVDLSMYDDSLFGKERGHIDYIFREIVRKHPG